MIVFLNKAIPAYYKYWVDCFEVIVAFISG
jgi:hypothetical protein